MKSRPLYQILLSTVLSVIFAAPAFGAKPYKIYVINKYGAWDIVCDAYTVKKEDHIWEILRRKGRIAEQDFPRFVEILKEMNPGIKDVNKIYPNQKILIPLKQLPLTTGSESVSGPRYVTIPMLPDVLYQKHTVTAGESLSKIVAKRFGVSWHEISDSYKETLKRLNPRIKDLDLIYAGETMRIPVVEGQHTTEEKEERDIPQLAVVEAKPESQTVSVERSPGEVASSGPDEVDEATAQMTRPTGEERPDDRPSGMPDEAALGHQEPVQQAGEVGEKSKKTKSGPVVFPPFASSPPVWQDTVAAVINTVGGKLLTSGHIRFPSGDRGDVHLNLTAFPVVEFGGGKHLILELGVPLPQDLKERIRSFWRDLLIVHAEPDQAAASVLDNVFSSLFGNKIYREWTLPPFDDGVQATLRANWILTQENGQGQGRSYHAVTIVNHRDEQTSPAVSRYLKSRHVNVVDVVIESGHGRNVAPTETGRNKPETVLPTVIDGKGQEPFIAGIAESLGFFYERQVPLSFNYAGFQVQTTGNLIYGERGLDVVVDYGTFYGDAKSAIEAAGMQVLSFQEGEDLLTISRELLDALGVFSAENPVFFAANRSLPTTISLALPGFLVSYGKERKTLLTFEMPAQEMLNFLHGEKIKTLVVDARPLSPNPAKPGGHLGS